MSTELSSQRSVTVKVPASTANMGPGFDCFAAPLALQLTATAEAADAFKFETDLDVPKDRSNLLVRSFEQLVDPSGFAFKVKSEIPLSGGLGSSAAAVVAGLEAANGFLQQPKSKEELLALATEIEGHPDNVAAAIYRDRFVICTPNGEVVKLQMPEELGFVLVVPHTAVKTEQARSVLPEQVSLSDASYNVANAAALAACIANSELELIGDFLGDCLHQSYRAQLFPKSAELLSKAEEVGAIGVTVSGAGPTVAFWVLRSQSSAVLEALTTEVDAAWADVINCC